MLLLAIFGSPRKDGNTDLMMNSFLDGALSAAGVEVQKIYVRELAMSGCQSCGYCDEHGVCVQQDDMQKVYPFFDTAERIVIASPIYLLRAERPGEAAGGPQPGHIHAKVQSKNSGPCAGNFCQKKGIFPLRRGHQRQTALRLSQFDCKVLLRCGSTWNLREKSPFSRDGSKGGHSEPSYGP